jgi:HEAT repeat protein
MRYRLALTAAIVFTVSSFAQDTQTAAEMDPKQRVKQARELGKQGISAIPQLQPMLKDASGDVRLEAAKSIAEIGGVDSISPLLEAMRDNDPAVQIRAVDGIVNFYLPGYLQSTMQRMGSAIKNRFSDQNDQVIPGYVTVRPDVIEALAKIVRGGSSMESRANAARAVGILRGRAAVPELIQAVHTKDDDVLYQSLTALQKIGDPSAAPRILFLLGDMNEKVQIAALETVGMLRSKEALPDLRKAYDRARNDRIRKTALTSLAMIPDEANRKLFLEASKNKNEALRAAAVEGIGRLNDASDAAMLQKAFEEEKKITPRLASAFALVYIGKSETTEFSPLQYLVNTLNSHTHKGEAEAYLIELARQPQVRENIYPLMKKATKEEKIGLGRVMAASGDRNSIAALDTLSKDPDAEVAQESLRALRILKARVL